MSTELKPTHMFGLTQFSGPDRTLCLQLTQKSLPMWENRRDLPGNYVALDRHEARALARALMEWSMGEREEEVGDD